ncbi:M20 metallopeptidase family protein [Halalkalibacter okhensis]|uniref:M20 metallopeptidase family protein n=1 Tax=Halalkalibacter okhensis TaxID=333138 RepID=UPI0008A84D30|nr:M20 family metallopeptidase [Halalkalibacter okhensis]
MELQFKGRGIEIEQKVKEIRRHFHMYPELSHEEEQTAKEVQRHLKEAGIEFHTGFAGTGVLGVVKGEKPGRTVALRADMDALPIEEENETDYSSKRKGVMHACGHDAHTAMLLGTGLLLQKYKKDLAGTVLLVFQPAEEDAPIGGAKAMMEDGVFDQYKPDAIFAQHVWPDLPVGQIGVLPGPMMGNSDRVTIEIHGAGGHASMPHQTTDAIIVTNQVINALQTIISRNVDPLESAVITIGRIEGGSRYNVIADKVTIEGTVRTYKNEVKKRVKENLFKLVNGIAESMGATANIEYLDGYLATVNSQEWANEVKDVAQALIGNDATPHVNPSLGGEDFGRFLIHYPGAYYWLGTAIPSRDVQKPLHDPQFEIDESALSLGVEVMSQLAVNALEKLNEQHGGDQYVVSRKNKSSKRGANSSIDQMAEGIASNC